MYAREVEGRPLTFAVSGLLFEQNLVMKDMESGSLWSQMLGEAYEGELKDKVLDIVPSLMTDWRSWKRHHPQSSVISMNRTAMQFNTDYYTGDMNIPISIYVKEGKEAMGWSLDDLRHKRLVNAEFAGTPIVVLFDDASHAAAVFERTVDGRVLEFAFEDEAVVDEQTGSHWEALTGRAVSAPLEGTTLTRYPSFLTQAESWAAFDPFFHDVAPPTLENDVPFGHAPEK